MTARTAEIIDGWEGDEEVEAVLAEFDGDPRKAIRALLDDIAALAEDRPAEPRLVVVSEAGGAAHQGRHPRTP